MTAKFIVNSLTLRSRLKCLDLDLADPYDEYTLRCQKNKLEFEGLAHVMVECKEDFEIIVHAKQLVRLMKICGILEEQPLVVYYDNNRWINIQNCVM